MEPDAPSFYTTMGGDDSPPMFVPSRRSLIWLVSIRLVIATTLFVGALIIQAATSTILPLNGVYILVLVTFILSLLFLVLLVTRISYTAQMVIQLIGDIAVITGFVYVTGGLYSPFSFLYLTVIIVAAIILKGGGFLFAGLSSVAYGLLVDFMAFRVIPLPPNLSGENYSVPAFHILLQLLIHIVGFMLVAALVTYIGTSLRTTAAQLEEQQKRVRQFVALAHHVVQSIGSGLIATDLDGQILYLNPSAASILHIPDPASMTGRHIAASVPLDGFDWHGILHTGRSLAQQRLEARLAGSDIHLGLSLGPLSDDTGTQVGFIVSFQDLSEIEEARRRERLKDRMVTLGEMTVRVAHEIKNPLASISGSAQMLANTNGIDRTTRRLLAIIIDESKRLSTTLDRFLESARPHRLDRRPIDAVELLKDHVALLRGSTGVGRSHDIILTAEGPLRMSADPDLLRQVFWNLSQNALQAMPDGGCLEISATRRGTQALLRWCDTGEGMDEELKVHAFEPFVTTRAHGTGLGLALVYTLIDEHDGTVEIESRRGHGTTVTVVLPCTGRDA